MIYWRKRLDFSNINITLTEGLQLADHHVNKKKSMRIRLRIKNDDKFPLFLHSKPYSLARKKCLTECMLLTAILAQMLTRPSTTF